MRFIIQSILLLLTFHLSIYAQNSPDRLKIVGDSLKGKVIDGQNIREVIGHVIITQEDVVITCNKAIQYLSSNNAELIGNVIIHQDSVTIKTERGRYFGNIRIAYSDSAVTLNNGSMHLNADRGSYNLQKKVADFLGNVTFNDSSTTLTSTKLIYKKEIEEIVAVGNVNVSDSASIIKADSLIHKRASKYSEGFGNIEIINSENNVTIFGDHLIDVKEEKISKITGEPFLTQIEKLNDGTFDTLFIKSKYMEAKTDSTSRLFALDSVKIIRGNFYSVNDFTIYDRLKEQINIFKQKDKSQPILWYNNNQIVGDSIYINLDSSKIKSVDIIKDAILISQDSTYEFRYDQMSGDSIQLSFTNGKLSNTIVNGNVLSIYYLYEDREPNGLLKSSAKEIEIYFENGKVSEVKMIGSPISEYHPENKVLGNEKTFTLPTFYLYNNKPNKMEFKSFFLKNTLN